MSVLRKIQARQTLGGHGVLPGAHRDLLLDLYVAQDSLMLKIAEARLVLPDCHPAALFVLFHVRVCCGPASEQTGVVANTGETAFQRMRTTMQADTVGQHILSLRPLMTVRT